MAHFAEINDNNIVLRVLVVPDEEEHRGQDYLSQDIGISGRWIKTSYNTKSGVHYDPISNAPSLDQSKTLRKNYAGIGFFYDDRIDAFVLPKPEGFPSWVVNSFTGQWEPPKTKPDNGKEYYWDESTVQWIEDL